MVGGPALWVFVAGGAGSLLRYGVTLLCVALFGGTYPLGTLTVNTVGCFLLALLVELAFGERVSPVMRVVLGTGFLGGFTTYSTFSLEAYDFFRSGAVGLGLAYLSVTVLGCLAACWLGQLTARAF